MADVFDEIAPDESSPVGDIFDQIEAEKPVVRDVPRGTLEPTDLFPGIRKMGGEIVPGQLGETHQDIIKREGIKAEDLDQRIFVTPWGDVIDREGAANAVFPKVIPQFEPGRLHSTDLNALQTPGEFEKRLQAAAEEEGAKPLFKIPEPSEQFQKIAYGPTRAIYGEKFADTYKSINDTIVNAAKSVPEFLSTEEGMLSMLASLNPLGRAGVEAYFTYDMAKNLWDQAKSGIKDWDSLTIPQKASRITQAAVTLGFLGLLSKAGFGTVKGAIKTPSTILYPTAKEAPPTERPGEAPLAAPTEGKAEVGEVVQAAPTEPAITTDKTVLPEKQVELSKEVAPDASPVETYAEALKRGDVSTTGEAGKIGLQAKTVADLDTLLEAQRAIKKSSSEAKTPTEKFRKGVNVQFTADAIKAAINAGSEAEGVAGTVLGERPLDWRKNPDVAEWIKKNAKELGLEVPEGTTLKAEVKSDIPEVTQETQPTEANVDQIARFWPKKLNHKTGIEYGVTLTDADIPRLEQKLAAASKEQMDAMKQGNNVGAYLGMAKATFYQGALAGASKGKHIAAKGNYEAWVEMNKAKTPAAPDMGLPTTAAAPVAQEPAIVGMGGAVPGEFKPAAATPTGIKNATVDAERAKRGLPPAIQPVRRSFGEVWDRAMAKIDNDPGYPDRLIGELRNKPRALTDAEDATILHRQIDLQNEYAKATRDLAQAYDDGRMLDVANEQARVAGLSDQLLDLYNIGKSVGTETGRGLAARRMMAYEDYSLAKMELDKRMANGGRPLTDAERAEVVRLNKKIEQTHQAHDEYVANTDARVVGQETTKAINEIVVKAAKERKAKKPRTPEQITADEAKTKANIKLRLNEGKKSQISSMVQKLARMFVERGIRERDALIDAVHGVLKDIDPAFTRRETMDAISGYGDFRQLTKDEISVKLRDLKGQMQQVAKLEDMQASKPPLKTGLERRIPSPEESRLIKLVNQAKNEFQIPISDEATQLKSSLDTLKTRLRNRTIELQGMLDRKEFAKKPKRIIQRDAEANRLHFEMTKAKIAWHEALMKDRLANRSVPKKVFDFGVELLNTSRAILTSLDLSAVLRQGGFIAFAHPLRALKSFPAMFRAFASEKGQHAANLEIANRKNFPLYNQSKLYLSEHGQKLSQMEEAYMSRWADKIPLVAGSQRAYVTFLNKLRADSFDAMANSLGRSGELSPVEANAIANFVNVATGRGNFGMKDNALVGLNTVFFAPRYVASRFQLIAGQPMYRGTARTRAAVAKEYGRFLIGAGLVYALAQLDGATVETDPRSADFGKLRYGNTRIDPMAGLLQSTVLLGRLGSGQVKTTTGKIVPIRGEKIPYGGATAADVTGRFLRSKLSPALGTGLNLLTGKDVVGQPVTLGSTAQNLLVPLSLQDVYDTMKEQGVPHGTIMMLLSTFGMGLQNYQDKNTKAPVIAKKDIFDTL